MTVADLLTKYAADTFASKVPSTRYQQEIVYRAVRQAFGDLDVVDLTPSLLGQWRDDLAQIYASGTVRRWLDTLSSVLNAGVRDYEVLIRNPMQRVRKPPESHGRERFLTPEERLRLLDACQQSRTPALHLLVLLALATGARRNELRYLSWRDVELTRGTLRFPRTKTGARRAVPLAMTALTALQAWYARAQHPDAWVFPGPQGHGPWHFGKAWTTARRRAALGDVRFHDLRHTAASYLCMSGASLVEVAYILGHKTMRMVQRYTHFTGEHTRATVERMAAQFLQE